VRVLLAMALDRRVLWRRAFREAGIPSVRICLGDATSSHLQNGERLRTREGVGESEIVTGVLSARATGFDCEGYAGWD
jgi:hypothetical protein